MKGFLMRARIFLDIFQESFVEWGRDHATLLAAALAYYGLFALAPLIIIILILINSLFHQSEQGRAIAQQVQDLAGQQAPPVVGELIDQIGKQAASFNLTILSFLVLIIGATGLFVQTKTAFRIIWPLKTKTEAVLASRLRSYLMSYVLSFLLIAFVAILLLASSVITAFLLPIGRMIEHLLPIQFGLLRLVTLTISLLVVTILFAVVYKTLFEVQLGWRDILPGSAIAALFLAIGNFFIEIFVSIVNIGSFYGAAGSLLIFLFWIYYSAQIFLFGAEFIKVSKRKKEISKSQEKI
ncbi:MAG TPA: YihY/virulence factor BrkB family protein [Methanotrichaceae archaeon]|nr:YihY/virulence factor BrkB family protein [Methanotrichaceae archaeon]